MLICLGNVFVFRPSPPEVFFFVIERRLAFELQEDAEIYSYAVRVLSDNGYMVS